MRKPRRIINIAVVLKLSGAAGRDILHGIASYAKEHSRWRLSVFSRAEDFTPMELLQKPALDGIITIENNTKGIEQRLVNSNIPIVAIGMKGSWLKERRSQITFVRNDDERIGRIAAEYLLSLGRFRSFGFIPSVKRSYWSLFREKGFRTTLRTHQLKPFIFRESTQPLGEWLESLPKPTAIMTACDELAFKVILQCTTSGIAIPKQLAVIGVDNDELLCDYSAPPLTSVLPDHITEGSIAAKELSRLLKARTPVKAKEVLCRKATLIQRESTKPTTPSAHIINEALRFIKNNASRNISVKEVVSHLGISRRLLEQRLKEANETSLVRAIQNVRLNRVARQLEISEASIGSIASANSFENIQHLANIFKRKFGKTMSEYRAASRTIPEFTHF